MASVMFTARHCSKGFHLSLSNGASFMIDDKPMSREGYGDTYAAVFGKRDDSFYMAQSTGQPWSADFVEGNQYYDSRKKMIKLNKIGERLSLNTKMFQTVVPRKDWPESWLIPEKTESGDVKVMLPYRTHNNKIISTGKKGRGNLGIFGPNPAVDPVVSRWARNEAGKIIMDNDGLPVFEVVVITRGDDGVEFNSVEEAANLGLVALPGGMVEPGHNISGTIRKEFTEEALGSLEMSEEEQKTVMDKVSKVFENGYTIYNGDCNDPRDTDNAWMTTHAESFHDATGDSIAKFNLKAGDDAKHVCWLRINRNEFPKMYAKHTKIVEAACWLQTELWKEEQTK